MNIMKITRTAAIGVVAIALSATAALAVEAQATGWVNVRSGPNVSFSLLSHLQPGQGVNISHQSNGWCYVQKSGPDGWVSCRYLTAYTSYRDDEGPSISLRFGVTGRGMDHRIGRYHDGYWYNGSNSGWYQNDGSSFYLSN